MKTFKNYLQEALSPKEKAKRLELIRKAVEKLNAKQDAKAKKDALAAIKAMESTQLDEFKTALAFFDLKTATKAEKLAIQMKIHKDSEYKNKQYTVHVDGKFTDITKWIKKLDQTEK